MLSIFIYQRKYSNQSNGVCLRLIEQAIANVSTYLQIFVLPAITIDRIMHVKYIFFQIFSFNSKTLSVTVKIFITIFEGECKYFSSIKLHSSRKLALSRNVL